MWWTRKPGSERWAERSILKKPASLRDHANRSKSRPFIAEPNRRVDCRRRGRSIAPAGPGAAPGTGLPAVGASSPVAHLARCLDIGGRGLTRDPLRGKNPRRGSGPLTPARSERRAPRPTAPSPSALVGGGRRKGGVGRPADAARAAARSVCHLYEV